MHRSAHLSRLLLACTVTLAACSKGDGTTDSAAAGAGAGMAAGGDSSAMAGGANAGGASAGASAPMNDAAIVSAVSASNAGEIAAGQIAQQQASNARVKTFARQMVTDHQAMQKQSDQLVTRANLTPQPGPAADSIDRANKAMVAAMQGVTGANFDRQYMESQVLAHQNTLAMLQSAAGMAQNAELKQLLTAAQPKVQAHLEQARQIQTAVGGSASTSGGATGSDTGMAGMKH